MGQEFFLSAQTLRGGKLLKWYECDSNTNSVGSSSRILENSRVG